MNNPIFCNGKEYISASRAALESGYAADYVGQLCRSGKIPAKLIGRSWYVDIDALLIHKGVMNSVSETVVPMKCEGQIVYEPDHRSLIPRLRKMNTAQSKKSYLLVAESAGVVVALLFVTMLGVSAFEHVSPSFASAFEAEVRGGFDRSTALLASIPRAITHSGLVDVSVFDLASQAKGYLIQTLESVQEVTFEKINIDAELCLGNACIYVNQQHD